MTYQCRCPKCKKALALNVDIIFESGQKNIVSCPSCRHEFVYQLSVIIYDLTEVHNA